MKGDLVYSLEYEIMEILAERSLTMPEFDVMPYFLKVEMVAQWEVNQEVTEYYNQKAENEANK